MKLLPAVFATLTVWCVSDLLITPSPVPQMYHRFLSQVK